MFLKFKKISENKKVTNATPNTFDGITFKSKLESYCYQRLKENGLVADYEKTTFTILDAFQYLTEKIRPISYTPDFVGGTFIIECKGFANDSFPLRWKLFKHFLWRNKLCYDLYVPRTKKDVDDTIEKILSNGKK